MSVMQNFSSLTADSGDGVLLRPQDLARHLGIPYETNAGRVRFWSSVHAWSVPHLRLGPRTIRFDPQDIRKWLESRRVGRVA
jgi:hypothetical protein